MIISVRAGNTHTQQTGNTKELPQTDKSIYNKTYN